MTENEVSSWLDSLGLSRYAALFEENEIDWEVLVELTAEDLVELGLPLGPRKKLQKAIAALATDPPVDRDTASAERELPTPHPSASTVSTPGHPESTDEAERRHLTVVFCDLVGSTELSGCMDPEDLATLLRSYQACIQRTVDLWGGHIARYMGDGVWAYFPLPAAPALNVMACGSRASFTCPASTPQCAATAWPSAVVMPPAVWSVPRPAMIAA